MGAGYNENLNIYYDEEYHIGNTRVYIVAPKIDKEENKKRWDHICNVASKIAKEMIDGGKADKLMKK